jgi:hypothetical protein
MAKKSPRLGKELITVIQRQIALGDPPETAVTFDRLIDDGHPEQEVYKMLACVLTADIFEMLKEKRPFDRELYARRLHALPTLPWEMEEAEEG